MAVAIGFGLGLACFVILFWRGFLTDAVAAGVTLVAIASYWLVFALMDGDAFDVLVHGGIAALFALVAILASPNKKMVIAFAIIAHGVFDGLQFLFLAPVGPSWWAEFCAALDVCLGGSLLVYWWRQKKALEGKQTESLINGEAV